MALGIYVGKFYQTLGRLRDAERILREAGDVGNPIVLAEVRNDVDAMRRYMSTASVPLGRLERFVKAGLIAQAKAMIERPARTPVIAAQNDVRAAISSWLRAVRRRRSNICGRASSSPKGGFRPSIRTAAASQRPTPSRTIFADSLRPPPPTIRW